MATNNCFSVQQLLAGLIERLWYYLNIAPRISAWVGGQHLNILPSTTHGMYTCNTRIEQ